MKKILYIFLCILSCQFYTFAYPQMDMCKSEMFSEKYQMYPKPDMSDLFSLNAVDAIRIPKGTIFHAKSDSDIISGSYKYQDISFVSINSFPDTSLPDKVVFRGKVVRNYAPTIGRSGEIKIKINKIIVNEIAYPVKATIKMANNKKVFGGMIIGDSLYQQNVKDAAAMGNSYLTRNNSDPCAGYCDTEHPVKTTFNLTKGAIINASSLVASPLIGLFGKGDNVDIKKMSDFVIKLENDISVAISCTGSCNINSYNNYVQLNQKSMTNKQL